MLFIHLLGRRNVASRSVVICTSLCSVMRERESGLGIMAYTTCRVDHHCTEGDASDFSPFGLDAWQT
jgi:hypothetical protein